MRSALTDSYPVSRLACTARSTISTGWTRFTAACTAGSKSCTPKLQRLKPRPARKDKVCSLTVRGSISTPSSASGVNSKWRHVATFLAQVRGDQVNFLADVVDIMLRTAGVLRDDLVAGAEVAQRTTERQVEIDGERRVAGRLRPFLQIGQQALLLEGIIETVCGGVRRIARAADVEASDKRFGNFNFREGD